MSKQSEKKVVYISKCTDTNSFYQKIQVVFQKKRRPTRKKAVFMKKNNNENPPQVYKTIMKIQNTYPYLSKKSMPVITRQQP